MIVNPNDKLNNFVQLEWSWAPDHELQLKLTAIKINLALIGKFVLTKRALQGKAHAHNNYYIMKIDHCDTIAMLSILLHITV